MAASSNPALAQETESLADFYRQRGESDRAEATLGRLGLPDPHTAASIPKPAEPFEEFPVEPHPAPTGDFLEDFGSESLAFEPETPAASPRARRPVEKRFFPLTRLLNRDPSRTKGSTRSSAKRCEKQATLLRLPPRRLLPWTSGASSPTSKDRK